MSSIRQQDYELAERIKSYPALIGYPSFYLFHLNGLRYALVSTGLHAGSCFGYIEESTMRLYGKDNFRDNGGLAWQHYKLYDTPSHIAIGDTSGD